MAIIFFLLPVFFLARKFPLAQPIIENYPVEPVIIQKAPPALSSNDFMVIMDTLALQNEKAMCYRAVDLFVLRDIQENFGGGRISG